MLVHAIVVAFQILLFIIGIPCLALLLIVNLLAPVLLAVLLCTALFVVLHMVVRGRDRALAAGTPGGVLLREARRFWATSWRWKLIFGGLVILIAVADWLVLPVLSRSPL